MLIKSICFFLLLLLLLLVITVTTVSHIKLQPLPLPSYFTAVLILLYLLGKFSDCKSAWLQVVETQQESPYGDPYALALHQHVTEYWDMPVEELRDAALLLSLTDLKDFNLNPMPQKALKTPRKASSVVEPVFTLSLNVSWADSDRAKSRRVFTCC